MICLRFCEVSFVNSESLGEVQHLNGYFFFGDEVTEDWKAEERLGSEDLLCFGWWTLSLHHTI